MTAPATFHPAPTANDEGRVFDAVAEAMMIAATYAETAMRFCEIRDTKGLAYATRCANAAVLTAGSMLDDLRPSRQGAR